MKKQRFLKGFFIAIILVCLVQVLAIGQNKVKPPEFIYTRYFDAFSIKDKFSGALYPLLEKEINDLNPNVGGEVYNNFTIPKEIIDTLSSDEIDKILYNALISFNTQDGILYFSHRRQEYRVFIEQSYSIKSTQDQSRLDDWQVADNEAIPDNKLFYVYQADSSFGHGAKKINVSFNKNEHQYFIKIQNEETIKYQDLIALSPPGGFLLTLIIERDGDRVSMYGITATKTTTFKLLRNRISISIVYRLNSLAKWFEDESLRSLKNAALKKASR